MSGPWTCGIDVGSSCAKAVLLDASGEVAAMAVRRTGVVFEAVAEALRQDLLAAVAGSPGDIARTIATGYGRGNVPYASGAVTELTCQATACWHLFRRAVTIVDVGGQDTKVIVLGDDGRRQSFQMNRRCASGTGAFLEEMAARLDTTPEGLEALAAKGTIPVALSSFCTVFAKSELLSLIRGGRAIEDIALGVYDAVVRRIAEMARLQGDVVLTGGAARPGGVLVRRFEGALGRPVLVPQHPQWTGALGAGLLAHKGTEAAG